MSLVKIKPYIIDETQNFTFANVTSTGNVTSNNANLGNLVYANFFIGYGNSLSNIQGSNVTGFVPNANVANTAYSVAVGNVSGIGNIATINIDGNASNILYGNGAFASAPVTYSNSNVASFLANYGSNTISSTGNITAANINGSFLSVSGNSNVGNLNTGGIVSATGNVTGNYILGNGAFLTGVSTSSNTIFNGNSNVFVNANSNITMAVAGNANVVIVTGTGINVAGYANVTGNANIGNVNTNIISASGNANVGNVYTAIISGSGNLTVANANLGNAARANFFIGSGNNLSNILIANISGIGNIATLNLDGNTSNVLYGNGVFAPAASPYGNSNVATFLANYGSNTITTTGNVSFGNISGTGLTSTGNVTLSGANVSLGNVSNLHITGGTANYILSTDGSGNLSWAAKAINSITVDNFTGNGVQTNFTLSVTPTNINLTTVNYNGATMLRTAYSLAGSTLIFSSAPANNSSIEVTTIGELIASGPSSFVSRTATGNGTGTNYTVSTGATATSVIVTLDGVVQTPTTDYTISGNVLTFTSAVGNNVGIQIRELGVSTTSAGISTGKAIAMAIVFGF